MGLEMNHESKSENLSCAIRGGQSLSVLAAALLATLVAGGTAVAEQSPSRPGGPAATVSESETQTHPAEPASLKTKESLPRISKFEARQFRHACQERANERGLKVGDRESFLTRCFFGRRAQKGVRRECKKQGAAKGLDKTALRDFVRECVREQRNR
jgi:hypothetical protein